MLSKLFAVASLTIGLLVSPAAISSAVMSGVFQDGTTVHWVCPDRKEFNMPFQVTLPDGTVYQAVLVCGKVA